MKRIHLLILASVMFAALALGGCSQKKAEEAKTPATEQPAASTPAPAPEATAPDTSTTPPDTMSSDNGGH